jgi:hypothetical protein
LFFSEVCSQGCYQYVLWANETARKFAYKLSFKTILTECPSVFNTEEPVKKIILIFGINIWYVPVFFFSNSDFFQNLRWGEDALDCP